MDKNRYDTDDIIFALATPWGSSALAVLRVSGKGSVNLVSKAFSRGQALLEGASHTLVHGYLIDKIRGRDLDEVVVALFKDGRGYTGEESLEISCHGSMAAIQEIFRLFEDLGMRPASPGEFTFRAFMHGKMDLTQAEAVMEVVSAQSQKGHAMALKRLEGDLFSLIEGFKQELLNLMSILEVQLDYGEDEVEEEEPFPIERLEGVQQAIEQLLATYAIGKLYSEGAKIVLAGATNVGKSTLFNLFLKEERAIVSPIHGTTRDFIESQVNLEGIPIRLYDTAGLRATGDLIEEEGIKRTHRLLEEADLILLMFDGSEHDEQSLLFYENIVDDPRCIVVWNKSDLALSKKFSNGYALSAKRGEGFKELSKEMLKRLKRNYFSLDEQHLVIESARQYEELARAKESLGRVAQLVSASVPLDIIAGELSEALNALGSLTGEVTSSDILKRIFSNFCVGK
ncbi:MAG: tRNA uridine-5-carboxymethylaminomethyl(34) synthesis GTPase MnmE [Sphaerochaetaceae bacterium]